MRYDSFFQQANSPDPGFVIVEQGRIGCHDLAGRVAWLENRIAVGLIPSH